jgi:hypothetical protein
LERVIFQRSTVFVILPLLLRREFGMSNVRLASSYMFGGMTKTLGVCGEFAPFIHCSIPERLWRWLMRNVDLWNVSKKDGTWMLMYSVPHKEAKEWLKYYQDKYAPGKSYPNGTGVYPDFGFHLVKVNETR